MGLDQIEIVISKGGLDQKMFTCAICTCDYDENNAENEDSELTMLGKCGHTFCRECFAEFYRSLIEDQNRHFDLKCP